MNEFDLQAAKRGEKVQFNELYEDYLHPQWVDVHFLGVDKTGFLVIEIKTNDFLAVNHEYLRMAPKPPKKMWVQLCADKTGKVFCGLSYATAQEARNNTAQLAFYIGEPQPIEVPDE